jgi:hypothetical protein
MPRLGSPLRKSGSWPPRYLAEWDPPGGQPKIKGPIAKIVSVCLMSNSESNNTMSEKTQQTDEGLDAENAEGQGTAELAQTDEAEATAAKSADELQEGEEGEQAANRLSQGDDLSRKP